MWRVSVPAITLTCCCFAQGGDSEAVRRVLPPHVRLVPSPSPLPTEPSAVVEPPAQAAGGRCAHILVYVPDPSMDEKMIFPRGVESSESRMPAIKALPPCPEDVRFLPKKR